MPDCTQGEVQRRYATRAGAASNSCCVSARRFISFDRRRWCSFDRKPVTQLGIEVRRQDGETVLTGEAWCYTFSGPADAEASLE